MVIVRGANYKVAKVPNNSDDIYLSSYDKFFICKRKAILSRPLCSTDQSGIEAGILAEAGSLGCTKQEQQSQVLQHLHKTEQIYQVYIGVTISSPPEDLPHSHAGLGLNYSLPPPQLCRTFTPG